MVGFEGAGRILIIIGTIVLVLGLLITLGGKLPFFGRLPGDIIIRRDSVTVYFPVVSFILLSIILTVIINLVFRLLNK